MDDPPQNVDTGDAFKTPCRKRGRPRNEVSSSKGSSVEGRVISLKKARTAKEQMRKDYLAEFDKPANNTRSGGFSNSPMDMHEVLLPQREGRVLTQSEIMNAIRVIIILKREKQDKVLSGCLMERASLFTDISKKKLHELWNDYEKSGFTTIPPAYLSGTKSDRLKRIGREWIGPIREKMLNVRMKEGKAVEIPDLVKWFRDEHNLEVKSSELRYRLIKYGFKFGKLKKVCLRREATDVTRKRREFLATRKYYNFLILQNDREIKSWLDNKCIGPCIRRLMYVYTDESYVNKNHCIGYTWYHKDDEYGAAGNIPTGKGERLVMLTAITKELGLLCDEDDKKADTLYLFKADKKSGDYHKMMNADNFSEWLEKLFYYCDKKGIKMILVLDNASYHTTPALGSVNPASWLKKKDATDFLYRYELEYRPGRAPRGDSLDQLRVVAKD